MKKLKALLINGSPRAKGCTYTAYVNNVFLCNIEPLCFFNIKVEYKKRVLGCH